MSQQPRTTVSLPMRLLERLDQYVGTKYVQSKYGYYSRHTAVMGTLTKFMNDVEPHILEEISIDMFKNYTFVSKDRNFYRIKDSILDETVTVDRTPGKESCFKCVELQEVCMHELFVKSIEESLSKLSKMGVHSDTLRKLIG